MNFLTIPSLLTSQSLKISYHIFSSISLPNNSFISYLVIKPFPSKSNSLNDYSIFLLLNVLSLLIEAVTNSLKSTFPDLFASN